MDEVLKFLKENPTFYFATVDDNKPKVRPFGFFMFYENKLYFGMGKHKASYRQILANPYAEICTANTEGVWLRINGRCVVDERTETMDKAFESRPHLLDIYNEKSGLSMCVFYLEDATAEIADIKGNFKSIAL